MPRSHHEKSPPEGWQRWMLDQVEAADIVLVACTEQYDRRFRGHEEFGQGRGVTCEGGVIIQELYDAQGQNSKFIPIIFPPEDSSFISSPLRSATHYRLNTTDGYESLYRRLTNQLRTRKPELGNYIPYRHVIANRFSQILRKLLALKDHQPLILVRSISLPWMMPGL